MPFGLIFGALFFGLFCGLFGLRLMVHPLMAAKLGGTFLALLGGSLALGLLQRKSWARWTGAFAAFLLAGFGLRLVALHGNVSDHLLLFASLGTTLLLLVPATGDPRRGAPASAHAGSRGVGGLGWTALISLVGVLGAALWATPQSTVAETQVGALPAAAIGKHVRWSDFGTGQDQARAAGKPILATVVTDWCPYCSKMTKKTWRSSRVVERLDELVTVRIDAEDRRERNGYSGAELAARYDVQGYPVQLLLDPDGRVLSRYDGYQTPEQLLSWLDAGLSRFGQVESTAALRGSSD